MRSLERRKDQSVIKLLVDLAFSGSVFLCSIMFWWASVSTPSPLPLPPPASFSTSCLQHSSNKSRKLYWPAWSRFGPLGSTSKWNDKTGHHYMIRVSTKITSVRTRFFTSNDKQYDTLIWWLILCKRKIFTFPLSLSRGTSVYFIELKHCLIMFSFYYREQD